MFWVLKRTVSLRRDGSFEYPQHMFWLRKIRKLIFWYAPLTKGLNTDTIVPGKQNYLVLIVNIFLTINFNIYFGCSKEPVLLSAHNMFWLRNNSPLLKSYQPARQLLKTHSE